MSLLKKKFSEISGIENGSELNFMGHDMSRTFTVGNKTELKRNQVLPN
jgi:hypothetical protein